MVEFLEHLNDTQREAVTNYNGPSLVIAGAGSGKTRVLTYRIAYLLKQGIPPYQILALTFTNKAAREMKDRIGNLIGFDSARHLWMGTFHSIFAKILRYESDKLGYSSNFTIYDTSDSKNLVKSIIKEKKLDDKIYKVSNVYGRISSAKNNLITAEAYYNNPQIQKRDLENKMPQLGEIYKMYTRRCKKADAMDFDDLLVNTNILFRDHKDVLSKYQNQFKYVLVDEYQDTNFAQYLIINKLASLNNNVCVVGDDAQSIYSFRGAKIENILNFRKDYPEYKLYKLEQNYRSTQTIVNAANSVISKNKNQIEKVVFSKNSEGDLIQVIKTMTDSEEGFVVANSILDTVYQQQLQYSDFAILYRTNAQSRIFEESLRKRNIPYKVYGSLSFYQRKEIKDLLGYFRLIINKNDDEAFKRIINYPARGIGNTTIGKIDAIANEKDVSLWNVIANAEGYQVPVNQGTMSKLKGFYTLISQLIQQKDTLSAYDLALKITNESGISKELHNGKSPEEVSRYENIQELLNGIKEFTEAAQEEGSEMKLENYLENVALLTDADNEKEEDRNKVSLMTMHAAKGLEFRHVFIAGVEEELFPSSIALNSIRELEEERRLFYVALTRAEQKITLSYAQTRYKWGSPTNCLPSRFIKEIDGQYIDLPSDILDSPIPSMSSSSALSFNRKPQFERKVTSVQSSSGTKRFVKLSDANKQPAFNRNPDEEGFKPDDPGLIQEGMLVQHIRFGKGRVLKLEGEYPNKKAHIFFNTINEEKQLLLKFAKLKIVE